MNKEAFLRILGESKVLIEAELSEIEHLKKHLSDIEYVEKKSFCKGKLHVIKAYIKAFGHNN